MEEKKLIKLDIACGQNKREGFVGVDIAACPGVDFVHDLNVYPWPFEANSVEEAFCSHYIEHIPMEYICGKDALFCFFDEVHRILVPGGKIQIVAPYYSSMRAWQDPTHRRAITDATFFYLSKSWREANKLDHYSVTCDFDTAGGYAYDQAWTIRNAEAQGFAARHYINAVNDIWVTLTKK